MNTPSALHLAVSLGFMITSHAASLSLPRSSPERQGVSSSAILDFVRAADEEVDAMNSFMLVRHGQVVAEGWWTPYSAETRHVLYSLSKSFTSTAVGLAVAEGLLSIDDLVTKFFPEEIPADASANLKAMRVRDLLCMSTGHQVEPRLTETNQLTWTASFLAHPAPFKPGTHFLYNTPATYMQSAIVQKVTGLTTLDYLRPRLFEPLGIVDPTWDASPQGISLGGYGLSIRTEDIAKFGQLLLQKGKWQGKHLVPAAWINMATSRQTSNGSNPASDWEQGYGYQFWRCRHGCYRGDGAFGQYCIVMPDKDAVIAITSGTRDMQAVLNLIWDKLFAALVAGSLPENEQAERQLKAKLASLALRMPEGAETSAVASRVAGKKYAFETNDQKIESIALETPSGSEVELLFRVNGAEYRVPCGYRAWQKGRMAHGRLKEQAVAGSGAWTSEDTYTARLSFYEGPAYVTMALKFAGDDLVCNTEYNVAFGATKQPALKGRAAP